jgi:hypothetical protein
MFNDGVLPPGLTPRTAGANLLPWKRSVDRAGDTWHGRLVEVTCREAGQPLKHGLSRGGAGPLRLRFQLSGPDRFAVGKPLQADARRLGYDADDSIWR